MGLTKGRVSDPEIWEERGWGEEKIGGIMGVMGTRRFAGRALDTEEDTLRKTHAEEERKEGDRDEREKGDANRLPKVSSPS